MLALLSAEEPAEGFRFTQGWGSVGTILVGFAALVIAAVYNRKTLKVSAERHTADRRDKYNEMVRSGVVQIVTRVNAWGTLMSRYATILKVRADDIDSGNATHSDRLMQWAIETDDSAREAQQQMLSALLSSRLLTTHPLVEPKVNAMLEATYQIRGVIDEIEYDNISSTRVGAERLEEIRATINVAQTDLLNDAQRAFPFIIG